MSAITFVTGNSTKIKHAQDVLGQFNIQVTAQDCAIDEIQSHDPSKIGLAKAQAAFQKLNQPLVVNDHFWSISALRGFPGGYMKDVNEWFEAEDFINLMKGKTDKSAMLTEQIVYIDEHELKQFMTTFRGSLTDEKRGTGTATHQQIFVPEGSSRTFAEYIDNEEYSAVLKGSAWYAFADWYMSRG